MKPPIKPILPTQQFTQVVTVTHSVNSGDSLQSVIDNFKGCDLTKITFDINYSGCYYPDESPEYDFTGEVVKLVTLSEKEYHDALGIYNEAMIEYEAKLKKYQEFVQKRTKKNLERFRKSIF